MDPFALALFAAALILNSAKPGPSIAALVSRVIARGWSYVAPFVAAMWIGEVIWLTLAMAGLSTLAESFHSAFVILKYLGVAYLVYLAWKMWTEPVRAADDALPPRQSARSMFLAGFALVTVTGLAVVDLLWIALAQSARSFLKTPRAMRAANRIGATALGGAAAVIASR